MPNFLRLNFFLTGNSFKRTGINSHFSKPQFLLVSRAAFTIYSSSLSWLMFSSIMFFSDPNLIDHPTDALPFLLILDHVLATSSLVLDLIFFIRNGAKDHLSIYSAFPVSGFYPFCMYRWQNFKLLKFLQNFFSVTKKIENSSLPH